MSTTVKILEYKSMFSQIGSMGVMMLFGGMLVSMATRNINTAGPMYAKRQYFACQGEYMPKKYRPWNAADGPLDERPDCRAWLYEIFFVAIQQREGEPWLAGKVDKDLRKIMIHGGEDIEIKQTGEPYHVVEIKPKEFYEIAAKPWGHREEVLSHV